MSLKLQHYNIFVFAWVTFYEIFVYVSRKYRYQYIENTENARATVSATKTQGRILNALIANARITISCYIWYLLF